MEPRSQTARLRQLADRLTAPTPIFRPPSGGHRPLGTQTGHRTLPLGGLCGKYFSRSPSRSCCANSPRLPSLPKRPGLQETFPPRRSHRPRTVRDQDRPAAAGGAAQLRAGTRLEGRFRQRPAATVSRIILATRRWRPAPLPAGPCAASAQHSRSCRGLDHRNGPSATGIDITRSGNRGSISASTTVQASSSAGPMIIGDHMRKLYQGVTPGQSFKFDAARKHPPGAPPPDSRRPRGSLLQLVDPGARAHRPRLGNRRQRLADDRPAAHCGSSRAGPRSRGSKPRRHIAEKGTKSHFRALGGSTKTPESLFLHPEISPLRELRPRKEPPAADCGTPPALARNPLRRRRKPNA